MDREAPAGVQEKESIAHCESELFIWSRNYLIWLENDIDVWNRDTFLRTYNSLSDKQQNALDTKARRSTNQFLQAAMGSIKRNEQSIDGSVITKAIHDVYPVLATPVYEKCFKDIFDIFTRYCKSAMLVEGSKVQLR